MKSLRLAFGFLTALPVASADEAPTSTSRAWFPFVGLALGAALVGLDALVRLGLPALVVGALLVVAMLIMTRALHTEGFLDCCDGLFGGFTREDRLRILRDTHVGAFAVVGGAALLLTKCGLLASTPDEARVGLLLLFPCLARFGMLATMELFPYARADGLGSPFQTDRRWWQIVVGLSTAVLATVLFLGGAGFILLGSAVLAAIILGKWMSGLLGGLTGDAYGAVNELCEVVVLILGVALIPVIPDAFQAPLW